MQPLLKQTELDLGQDEALAYHDPQRPGFVAFLRLNADGRVRQTSVWLETLPDRLKAVEPDTDTWFAQSEFSRPNRRVVNLWRLPVAFLDLDVYKSPRFARLDASSKCYVLLEACRDVGLPQPSLVVFSGRGLQAKWVLDPPAPAAALPRWQALQSELLYRLRDLQSDAQALDASRALRLVGTINSRSGEYARVVHRAQTVGGGSHRRADGMVVYDFDILADLVLPFSRAELQAMRSAREADFVERDIERNRKEALRARLTVLPGGRAANAGAQWPQLRRLAPSQLAWDRLADIRTLVKLRYGPEGPPPGQRNKYVFLGACFLAQAVTVRDFMGEVYELARSVAPKWSGQELKSCVASVMTRAQASLRGERVEFMGALCDPRYSWRNTTLVERLGITSTEEEQLKTIMSATESKRRDAARACHRRREAGSVPRGDYLDSVAQRRATARLLRAKGNSFQQIADELAVSVNAVRNYCAPP